MFNLPKSTRPRSAIPVLYAAAVLLFTTYPTHQGQAQALDIVVDASVGSGMRVGSSGTTTDARRNPAYLSIDTGFIFDEDTSMEWTSGTIIQVEDRIALGIEPQVRILNENEWGQAFALAGVPWFITPFRRMGVELGGGTITPMTRAASLVIRGTATIFFAGGDVPDDTAILVLNLGIGSRFAF